MNTEKPAHAKLAPSSSNRWLGCPGSISLEAKCPEVEEGKYAPEGTAGHMLVEKCAKGWHLPWSFIGHEFNGFIVDDEMAEAAQVYLDEIWGLVSRDDIAHKRKHLYIEEKFTLPWVHPDIWGTSDCAVYDVEPHKLTVIDFKYGKGVVVEPEHNSQLMIYALGAMYSIWNRQTEITKQVLSLYHNFDEVELVIVQPRADHRDGPVRRWATSAKDLMFWATSTLREGALRTQEEKAPLKPGAHCRFCKAIAVCPAHAARACEIAKVDFAKPLLPAPEDLTPDDIAKVLEVSKAFSNWAGQVKAFAMAEMQRGKAIPGYKLVARKANRRWRQHSGYQDQLYLLLGEGAYKPRETLSVAGAEAACKKLGIKPKVLADFWEKPDAGVAIADESDSRKALVSSVEEDFDIMDFLL